MFSYHTFFCAYSTLLFDSCHMERWKTMRWGQCQSHFSKMKASFSSGLPDVRWKLGASASRYGGISALMRSSGSKPIRSVSLVHCRPARSSYFALDQLQRVIRTGRTGHWLNHTKEHMLVGVKRVLDANGQLKFPSWANRGVDTDVIVSEVRETSRKPEEVYGLIERLCPGGRKVEIFGRKHNTRPGWDIFPSDARVMLTFEFLRWLTLGNQLGADQIYEEDLALRIKSK